MSAGDPSPTLGEGSLLLAAPEHSPEARRSDMARTIFEASQDAAPYLEDYWALRAEGWPWRQAVYMLWASLPRETRWPKTQGELARDVLGLGSDRAIREWRDKNVAMDARIAKLAASLLAKHRAEIYQALVAAATNPDPRAHQDRRMALEMLGDYVPKQRIDVATPIVEEFRELGTEQLAAIAHDPGGAVTSD